MNDIDTVTDADVPVLSRIIMDHCMDNVRYKTAEQKHDEATSIAFGLVGKPMRDAVQCIINSDFRDAMPAGCYPTGFIDAIEVEAKAAPSPASGMAIMYMHTENTMTPDRLREIEDQLAKYNHEIGR